MEKRTYWLAQFTVTEWQEFLRLGAVACGIRQMSFTTLTMAEVGDRLLCYLPNLLRFIGILEITDENYKDPTDRWQPVHPKRVGVRIIVELTPETAVPIVVHRGEIITFRVGDLPLPYRDGVLCIPDQWNTADGEAVADTILKTKPKSRGHTA